MKTFITELNHEQVDVMGKHYPDHVIYFNAKIHWGLELFESQRELDIRPFIDRIEVFSGEDARASNKMLIVKDDFLDIFNNEESQYEITQTFLRDKPASEDLITIFPKFVGIDISKKEVEVLFNA
tara:strand:+ start:948 stop:1322 length:375 start_codon:yes stop_codon:yes gene_type:complete